MKHARKHLWIAATLLSALVVSISGCNGGSAAPPPISVSLSPNGAQTIDQGQSKNFTANLIHDTGKGVTWKLTQNGTSCSPGCGTIAPANTLSGAPATYTAPAAINANVQFTVTATSVSDSTKSNSDAATAVPPPVANNPANLPAAVAGQKYSYTLTETGGVPPFTWSIISGTLPQGFTLDSGTGVVSENAAAAAAAKPAISKVRPEVVAITDTFTAQVVDSGTPQLKATQALSLTVNPAPAPSITSLNPSSGPALGGTMVTITGANFQNGATVTFGAAPGTSIVVVSATSITVVTPAMAAGPVNVSVVNPDGQTATATGAFTAVPPPTISSISPNSGPAAGGTSVTITGKNFKPGATVTFGGTPGVAAMVVSGTSITVVTPAMVAGPVDVVVTNPDGQKATATAGFTAVPPPTISSISPNSGLAAGGTSVTITGTNFKAGATVTFGGTPGVAAMVVSGTSITVVTPAMVAGSVNVVVTNPDGQKATATGGFTAVAAPPPTISSINPNSGPATGGTSVTITGTNFKAGATVTFGGTPGTMIAVVSATSITVVTPAMAAGPVDVVVINPDGQKTTSTGGFTFKPNQRGTTTTAENRVVSMSASSQNVSLFANVFVTNGGPVTEGTVTFTIQDSGGKTVGAAVQSGTITNSSASAVYALPGGTAAGTYTINAAYNLGPDFAASSDNTHALTVNAAATGIDLTIVNATNQILTTGHNTAFQLTVNNVGNAPTTQPVTVTDNLQIGMTYLAGSASGAGWDCSASGGQIVSCTTPKVGPNGISIINYIVNVTAAAGTVLKNTATISVTNPDTDVNPSNNSSTDTETVVAGFLDLGFSMSHTGGNLMPGINTVYTLNVTNVGTEDTTQLVTVSDTLPSGLTLVSASGTNWNCSAAGQAVTCTNPGPIQAFDPGTGAISTSKLALIVSTAQGTASPVMDRATVSVMSPDLDANPGNNTATDTANVGPLTTCDFETSGFGPPNSNGALKGSYTYFFSGHNSKGDYLVRTGSFYSSGGSQAGGFGTFGGLGNPPTPPPGEEDLSVVDPKSGAASGSTGAVTIDITPDPTTKIPASNYCIDFSGAGWITLQDTASKKPVTYRIAGTTASASPVFTMIEFDPTDDVRGSGIIVFQGNPGVSPPNPIPGLCDGTSCAKAYVLEFSGRDSTVTMPANGGPIAMIAEVDASVGNGEDWFNDPLNTSVSGGVASSCGSVSSHCVHNSTLTVSFDGAPDANGRVQGSLKTGAGTGPADDLRFAGYIFPALKYFGEGKTTGNPISIFAINLSDGSVDAANEASRVLGGEIFAQSEDPSTTRYTKAALNGVGAFFYLNGYDPSSNYANSVAGAGFALLDGNGNVTKAIADFDVGGVLCPLPGVANPTCPLMGNGTYTVASNGGAGFTTTTFGANFAAFLSNSNEGVLIDLSPSAGIGRILPGAFGSFPSLNVSGFMQAAPPTEQDATVVTGSVAGGGCLKSKTTCSFNLTEDVDTPGTGLTIGLPETLPGAIELGSFCAGCATQWDTRFAVGTAGTGGNTATGVPGACPSPGAAPGPHDVCMIGYGTGAVNRNILIDESTTNPVIVFWGFPVY